MQHKTIAYAAGTSGGHIIPCLTLAQQEKVNDGNTRIIFFSTDTPLDHKILGDQPTIDSHIRYALETKRAWYLYPKLVWQLASSFWHSFMTFRTEKPTKLVSSGGLIALPICCAAWLQNIPIELWELNAVPGEAIAQCARFASKIIVNLDDAQRYFPAEKCVLAPYPVKYAAHPACTKNDAYAQLQLDPHKKTILILGGSQGSVFLNTSIQAMLTAHKEQLARIQIIHQTGDYDQRNWHTFYRKNQITAHVFPFADDLAPHYAIADLIVCRSGAGTLHENIFFNKPFITIPLEADTTNHQIDNALAIQKMYPQLCHVLRQDEIMHTPELLYEQVQKILS